MKTYLIFIVQAYKSATDTGALSDVTTLELISDSEVSAIKKAKTLIKKDFYRISNVIEKES